MGGFFVPLQLHLRCNKTQSGKRASKHVLLRGGQQQLPGMSGGCVGTCRPLLCPEVTIKVQLKIPSFTAMPTIAETMLETITASLRSTLRQEGLTKAREQWLVLNDTMSTEDWWPQVARAARQLFDDYAAEQERKQQERLQAGATNITYVNNNNNSNNITNENSQTDQRCWGMKVEKADQLIGVAEQDSKIIYSKMNNLTT